MSLYTFARSLGAGIKNFVKNFNRLDRISIAGIYLKGEGIEVGALHNPLAVPKTAKVRYVDRMLPEDLRKQYPEIPSSGLVPVDIVDNGETLGTIPDNSQDFVIANSFVEHCEDPILAFSNFLRVLKNGGVLYLAIPDKRFTFDAERAITPMEHILRDFREGPEWSRLEHYRDWAENVVKPPDVQKSAQELMDMKYSIHFHVWDQAQMMEMIAALNRMFVFDVEMMLAQELETIFLIRKR